MPLAAAHKAERVLRRTHAAILLKERREVDRKRPGRRLWRLRRQPRRGLATINQWAGRQLVLKQDPSVSVEVGGLDARRQVWLDNLRAVVDADSLLLWLFGLAARPQ